MLCLRNEVKKRDLKIIRVGAKTPDLIMYKKSSTKRFDYNIPKREDNIMVSGRILPMIKPARLLINEKYRLHSRQVLDIKRSEEKLKTALVNIKNLLKTYENKLDD